MLVLTRRIGEEIAIDSTIRVRVLSINGNQVRLGVTAPVNIGVWRSELVANAKPPADCASTQAKELHELHRG